MPSISLKPTSLAQYIRLENCERYLRFQIYPAEAQSLLKKWDLTIQPLSPLLQEAGIDFEDNVGRHIASAGEQVLNLKDHPPEYTLQQLKNIRKPTILLQASLKGVLGKWECGGCADAIYIEPVQGKTLRIIVADIKASRQERVEHRIQVAVYASLIRQMAQENGIEVSTINGAVLTMGEDGSIPCLNPATPTFDLDTFFVILDRLVTHSDSKVNQILQLPFEKVFYHLNYKCDGCFYNALCMIDSAERLDIALTPAITALEKRTLNQMGIYTLPELANLMLYPNDGSYKMKPNPKYSAKLDELRNCFSVSPNLPLLVQRAKAILKVFDNQVEVKPFLLESSFSTLPSAEDHPELIKIFFDAQHDYIKNRLYLLSALVIGPKGEKEIVKITPAPPTDEDEYQLLQEWISAVLSAVKQVSNSHEAPLHLYCYNKYDQKVLLEALKRHIGTHSTIPGFFDLMTQSPALTQNILSFLYDELRERYNLGLTCLPLHDAARRIGFDWQDMKYAYYSFFRAKMFDNRRAFIRDPHGNLLPCPKDLPENDPRRLTIEAASRFNAQIPLEYAYAVWHKLPEIKEERKILDPFKVVNIHILTSFAAMRVKALAAIEQWVKVKSKWMKKPPLLLSEIGKNSPSFSLKTALIEFLFMEHHSSLQEHRLFFNLPPERRIQSGRAMLLKYNHQNERQQYVFTTNVSSIGLDPELMMSACKFKEGDWVVVNELSDPQPTASDIIHGRLAMIIELSNKQVTLQFMDNIQNKGKLFCYFHKREIIPQVNHRYIIDEMVDDLNADKILASLYNIESNVFYHWLLKTPVNRRVSKAEFYHQFINQIEVLLAAKKRKLTHAQKQIIAETQAYPLVLIQGPPGTGKSYTLAWTILARIAAASLQNKTCRVVVCCKTHNAINVVLRVIAEAKQQLSVFGLTQLGGNAIRELQIYKISSEDKVENITGVTQLSPHGKKSFFFQMIKDPLIIIGATSGGLYNFMRCISFHDNHVDWNYKFFDLVVIDEASQMNVPEGVLAAAFLKPDGQMIIVGDHRQMPPITVHTWKAEEKRNIVKVKPFLSLFEFLIEKGFPKLALDESFRLHEDIAEFLYENIYSKDDIYFHSKRKELITPLPSSDRYTEAVLNPEYPIVVIEHTECKSQQFNNYELTLLEPIIQTCIRHLGLNGRNEIGIVIPHRAQKALLCQRFPNLAELRSIDTVERFQGDERDVIIVSATASDPDYVLSQAEFLLNLNRFNVAISRPRKKLIVIASQTIIDLLTSDLEIFEHSTIWKRLYYHYARDLLYSTDHAGLNVKVKGRRCKVLESKA